MATEGEAAVPAPLAAAVSLHSAVSTSIPMSKSGWSTLRDCRTTLMQTRELIPRKTSDSPQCRRTELSYDEPVEKASSHFCPKPSHIIKRFEFNTCMQGKGRESRSM